MRRRLVQVELERVGPMGWGVTVTVAGDVVAVGFLFGRDLEWMVFDVASGTRPFADGKAPSIPRPSLPSVTP